MATPPPGRRWDPRARDAALRRTRRVTALVAVAAAGGAGLLSVVAAQAFKGHSRGAAAARRGPATRPPAATRVSVPGPQDVPPISGQAGAVPAPQPAPPPQPAPAPAPQPAAPAPVTSGGS